MKRFLACLLAASILSPGFASAALFKCATESTQGGVVQDILLIQLNETTGEAMVLDPLINHIYGQAIVATTKKRSSTSWRLKWIVRELELRNGNVDLDMNAVLNLSRNSVNITGTYLGYDNVISGRGTCERVKG